MFSLKGKTAVVTGGYKGIGKGITHGLAKMGADIVIAARNKDAVQAVAADIQDQFGVRAVGIQTNVREEKHVKKMVKETISNFGKIDILVNNAGMMLAKLPQDIEIQEWDEITDVNLRSAFLCSKAVYPFMQKAGGGKIICIGSMYSIFGGMMSTAYGATKGGVVQLVKSLAVAWAPDNIQVNAILPGWIRTDMISSAEEMFPGMSDHIIARTPAGRMGDPMDLSGTAVFLASSAADFVTGAGIPVDGGWSVMG